MTDQLEPIVIFGAGGLGREVALMIKAANAALPRWELLGFADDSRTGASGPQLGLEIRGDSAWCAAEATKRQGLAVAIAVGSSGALKAISEKLRKLSSAITFPNISHPDASIDWDWIDAGEGNLVCAGARVANATFGSFNVVNMNTVLGHDCVVGDRCLISPSATLNGEVQLGSDITIGAGATVMPRISIADGATVTIGSVVGKSVRAGDVVAGNPARVVVKGPR